MPAHFATIATFKAEIARVGLEEVCADHTDQDGTIRLWDDHGEWTGSERTALDRLHSIPDGEGPEKFWDLFQ